MNPASGGGLLRVVVDTNVYVSAFVYPERPIFQIWQLALRRKYHLLVSPDIMREISRVLREDFAWEEERRIPQLKLLARVGEIIAPKITLNIIMEDPPDNRILECAVEGRADLIVSGDRHLRRLKVYQGIPIVRPIDFLRTLGVAVKAKR